MDAPNLCLSVCAFRSIYFITIDWRFVSLTNCFNMAFPSRFFGSGVGDGEKVAPPASGERREIASSRQGGLLQELGAVHQQCNINVELCKTVVEIV